MIIKDIPAPSSFANYLMNGDDSQLNENENQSIQEWLKENRIKNVLSSSQEFYTSYFPYLAKGLENLDYLGGNYVYLSCEVDT